MKKQKIYVNGYGATHRDDDPNYRTYLEEISRELRLRPHVLFDVYLCGGFTNRTDMTEASTMERIWRKIGVPDNVTLHRIENTISAVENLHALHTLVGDVPVVIFCEYSRRRTVDFLAKQFFSKSEVVGIPFDARSMRLGHRLRQVLINLPLTMLASRYQLFDDLSRVLRSRHIAAARARERARK